ncbi:hypothetical protein FRB95_004947 [Tulasnella sp. JGI-2019a]|nr:hypothetical protein FRB93_005917 [Tulasnella sp. JGI-2019a]KAG9029745.1 hypothetical protein FRB95_004947 [Tulasnella sp. JGI-2019a]
MNSQSQTSVFTSSFEESLRNAFGPSSAIRSRFTPGHKRDLSNSSVASCSTVSSVQTASSSGSDDRDDDGVVIVNPEDDMMDDVPQREPRARPISQVFDSVVKSIFRFSPPSPHLIWRAVGPVNLKAVEALAKAREGGVLSFKMARGSYVPHSRLAETLEHLAVVMPTVQTLVLVSQIYTLEELNGLAPSLAKFVNLRSISIFDAMDDPPTESSTIGGILKGWGLSCPTLHTVQFSRSTAWRSQVLFDDTSEGAEHWVEDEVMTL